MPKVLLLADSLSNGGAERQITLLAKYLPSKWQRYVWSLGAGPYVDDLRKSGITVNLRERRWRWDISPALDLWRIIREWQPDVVHSYGYMSTLAALAPCKTLRIPLVDGTIRQALVPKKRGRLWRWSLRWADRIIANSAAGLRAFDVGPDRGRVVYNGFDPARWPLCNIEPREADAPFRAIMVARMHPMKDYETLVSAARQLAASQAESFEFWGVGAGPDRERVLASAVGVAQHQLFVFPEPTLEVLPYVRQADVGVLMTRAGDHAEGCSNAIMEYMACQLPVICSDSGGNRELVVDGETGFVINSGDAATLAEKLSWLRHNPLKARQMGQAGYRRLLEKFTTGQLAKLTVGIYEEALARKKSR